MFRRRGLIRALLGSGAAIFTVAASFAAAPPSLDPMFADNAVLQRGVPLQISGTVGPGERVSVSLGGRAGSATADSSGRWSVTLPQMREGGPYDLRVTGADGQAASARNLLIGDVWLCSGQSNMEWPVAQSLNPQAELEGSADLQLRLMTIAKRALTAPSTDFAEPPKWAAASSETVAPFSAACYFMGRELRKTQRVPIGLINASWGGTAIRSWIDPVNAALATPTDAALLDLYRRDPAAANRQFGRTWEQWWSASQASRPWAHPQLLSWKPMPVGYWEQWGDPAFATFNGMVWARSSVTLSAKEAAQSALLSLGVIDEIDQAWVNGVAVGNTFGWDVARSYQIPAGLLKAGENSIVVAVTDSYGAGGFQGPDSILALRLADGTSRPLAPKLQYSVTPDDVGTPPRPPWDSAAGLSLIYNGMIAPLGPVRLKGVSWYQGESDAGMAAGYDARLQALVSGWRRQFGSDQLPFLIVGLPGWGPPHAEPTASGWAQVRDAQRRVGTQANAAFVPAIDVGDRLELHPPQKQEVGLRLARAATALAYGATHHRSGPQVARARREGNDVLLSFTGVTGALRSWSGPPVGFELCAQAQQSCRFARASVSGNIVRVHGDGAPFSRVRFAWADAPVVNLFDAVPLPVSSFELAVD